MTKHFDSIGEAERELSNRFSFLRLSNGYTEMAGFECDYETPSRLEQFCHLIWQSATKVENERHEKLNHEKNL